MIFTQFLVAIVVAAGLRSFAQAGDIPNGAYSFVDLEDGTRQWTSLEDPTATPYITTPNRKRSLARSARFSKRATDCRGYQLNEAAVDALYKRFREWAGNGQEWTARHRASHVAIQHQGVMVYYCINANYGSGNLDSADVDFAFKEMDNNCKRYEASWYRWDGSVEIVGKAAIDDPVCQG